MFQLPGLQFLNITSRSATSLYPLRTATLTVFIQRYLDSLEGLVGHIMHSSLFCFPGRVLCVLKKGQGPNLAIPTPQKLVLGPRKNQKQSYQSRGSPTQHFYSVATCSAKLGHRLLAQWHYSCSLRSCVHRIPKGQKIYPLWVLEACFSCITLNLHSSFANTLHLLQGLGSGIPDCSSKFHLILTQFSPYIFDRS